MLSARVSSLLCAGWLPQDGLFCWSRSRGLASSVIVLKSNGIAHRAFAGRFPALPPPGFSSHSYAITSSRIEHGQRPAPAGQFTGDRGVGDYGLRASNRHQRVCRRRLACCPGPGPSGWRYPSGSPGRFRSLRPFQPARRGGPRASDCARGAHRELPGIDERA
jgi:hypothetical protein